MASILENLFLKIIYFLYYYIAFQYFAENPHFPRFCAQPFVRLRISERLEGVCLVFSSTFKFNVYRFSCHCACIVPPFSGKAQWLLGYGMPVWSEPAGKIARRHSLHDTDVANGCQTCAIMKIYKRGKKRF